MKSGANKDDQAMIRMYARKKGSAKQISKKLGIELECVKSFMPKKAEVETKVEATSEEDK